MQMHDSVDGGRRDKEEGGGGEGGEGGEGEGGGEGGEEVNEDGEQGGDVTVFYCMPSRICKHTNTPYLVYIYLYIYMYMYM